jgi:hypothetical protein
MNILLLGSGGREHAIAWKIAQSPLLGTLYIAPGNAGTSQAGINLSIGVNDFPAIRDACLEYKIGLLVVGPEEPLVRGIHDYFLEDPSVQHIPEIRDPHGCLPDFYSGHPGRRHPVPRHHRAALRPESRRPGGGERGADLPVEG